MTVTELIKEKMKEFDNMIFPSKEDDGIEHVDASYDDFMEKIKESLEEVADLAYKKAKAGPK